MNIRIRVVLSALYMVSCAREPAKPRSEAMVSSTRTQSTRADPEFARSAFLCRAAGGILRVGVDGRGKWWSSEDPGVPFGIETAGDLVRLWCMTVGNSGDEVILLWEGRGVMDGLSGADRLNVRSGKVLWSASIPTSDLGDPLLTMDAVYFAGLGLVGRVDAESGLVVWQRAFATHRAAMDRPRLDRGRVVFRDIDGNVFAELDPASGEP